MNARILRVFLLLPLALGMTRVSGAQLPPPPVPPGNPLTEEKRVLGKILFWDEQLSSDDSVACGTCHLPERGGNDGRSAFHPGPDGVHGTLDDKQGSAGVAASDGQRDFVRDALFGFAPQVTTRAANSTLMAAYAPQLFWDGRAGGTFVDPDSGLVLLPAGGALENQVLGPPLSSVEMGHAGRDWAAVTARLVAVEPLALARDLPPDVAAALAAFPSYPELFAQAFGSGEISAARIALAIATYERTLVPDQTPWDRFVAGDVAALTPGQRRGWDVFRAAGSNCGACHTPPFFTNQSFRNIGLRPVAEDTGRQAVTGNVADRGRFKVPSLRNVGLKASFMHQGGVVQGGLSSVLDVLDFYIPANGHVQFADNRDPLVATIAIPPADRRPLADFLANGLTDPRAAARQFPFDRPTLRSELAANPTLTGTGRPGSGGLVPTMLALTPPHVGSEVFRLGVAEALGGATAHAVARFAQRAQLVGSLVLGGNGAGDGLGTLHLAIPASSALLGFELELQWFVRDPAAAGGFARSRAAHLVLF